ncbi:MAG: MarR family transcriptional regulator [Solirubrobacteraceae bacterium]
MDNNTPPPPTLGVYEPEVDTHKPEADMQEPDTDIEPAAGKQSSAARGASATGHSPAQSVGFTLSSLGHAVSRRFKATLAPLGLEPREFALLRTLAPREGASQQAIGERLQIPASRMVAFVDALEQRGLLERRPHPRDRRARALYLTEDGRELLARAFELASGLEAQLCAQLSASERKQLLDALGRVGIQLGLAPGMHSAHRES